MYAFKEHVLEFPALVATRHRLLATILVGIGTFATAHGAWASATVTIPIVRQVYRNNCETATLSMLLAGRGVRVGQVELQRALRRDGPLDPTATRDGLPVWGDPDKGFVGRVEGGGVAGGFGVYPGPIRRLARHYGVALTNVSRRPVEAVYSAIRRGRLVMAWVGLSDGPYRRWKTSGGKVIRANFGEHVILLVGLDSRYVVVHDPLTGTRTRWPRGEFETRFDRLARRALVN